jgi:hypothetical protein
VRISGTSKPLNFFGRVYTGYSFFLSSFLEKLSSSNDSGFHNTLGIFLTKESINTIAESSQLDKTYSPIETSCVTYISLIL